MEKKNGLLAPFFNEEHETRENSVTADVSAWPQHTTNMKQNISAVLISSSKDPWERSDWDQLTASDLQLALAYKQEEK